MKVLHRIGAVVAGLFAGGVAVALIEGVSSLVYKMPEGLDPFSKDTAQQSAFAEWIGSLPIGAFLFILAAWACGCFLGAFVARISAPNRSLIPGLIVWGFLTIASLFNLFVIPHPLWFWFAGILVCFVFGLLGLVAAAPQSYVIACTRAIEAPVEIVFKRIACIEEFTNVVPQITKVEFLSDNHYGVGTKFRETRLMNGKENSVVLEVTELVENEHVRMVSDAGGTVWNTVFRLKPLSEAVEMDMHMDCVPHNFPAKVLTPFILPMVAKAVESDMDSVKEFCELASFKD